MPAHKRTADWSSDAARAIRDRQLAKEADAKLRLSAELTNLAQALDDFLSGEVRDGLITPFKLTLIVQAKTMQALAERSLRDVGESNVRSEGA